MSCRSPQERCTAGKAYCCPLSRRPHTTLPADDQTSILSVSGRNRRSLGLSGGKKDSRSPSPRRRWRRSSGDTKSFSGDVIMLTDRWAVHQSRIQFVADDRLEHAGNRARSPARMNRVYRIQDRCRTCGFELPGPRLATVRLSSADASGVASVTSGVQRLLFTSGLRT